MKIPFRDLSVKDPKIKQELLEAVDKVLTHGRILLGPEMQQFEKAIAERCHTKFAVGVGSGTSALYFSLRALKIGKGDEVITTPLTWVATPNSIVMTGATPVYVDIKDDLNINVDLIEKAITPRTKAILPVHFLGKMCEIEKMAQIAKKHNIALIEDAAQAFGASVGGKPAGSFSKIAAFSMNPMKVLCAYGEAGACVTNDQELATKIESLRYAGTINKEDCQETSINGRLDTIQAAMMLVNLKYVDGKISQRLKIAQQYNAGLNSLVRCPIMDKSVHAWYSYTIIAEKRDELMQFLTAKGVETKIYHPILMPYHTAYKGKFTCSIPVAEDLVKKILALPNEDHLNQAQIQYVIDCIKEFYAGK